MKDSKAYVAMSSLNVYELNRFRKFIISPYFNVNENLVKLFDFYRKEILSDNESVLEKESVWTSIFPSQEFNDTRLRKLNSDFLRLLEEFLAQEQFGKNPLHRANYLLKALSSKELEKLYKGSISTARRLSNQQLERTASFYYYQYQIEKNLFGLTTEFEKKSNIKSDRINLNIDQIAYNLDLFYLCEKIKYYCTIVTWKNVLNFEADLSFIDDTIRQIRSIPYEDIPPLAIYYQIYLTFVERDNEEHFYKLKELISKHLKIFPEAEASDIYEATLNYCVAKVNSGNQEYFKEMFDLWEYGLNTEILMVNGKLDPAIFRNIAITALRLGKYDWTEKFIQTYNRLLDDRYRENAVIFNKARLETYRKNFDMVIELLREVTFDDIFYELSSKALQIVAYYELDEYEVLISFLFSFNTFLRRSNKISASRKNNYQKLIYFTRKLIKLTPRMKTDIKKLQTEINDSENFADKPWLLDKIAELQGLPLPSLQQ